MRKMKETKCKCGHRKEMHQYSGTGHCVICGYNNCRKYTKDEESAP